jgi:hypothetical protein
LRWSSTLLKTCFPRSMPTTELEDLAMALRLHKAKTVPGSRRFRENSAALTSP